MTALPRPEPMTLEQFLAWEDRQERKHEFVDGRPVAMAGASKRHNLICTNIIRSLGNRLLGKPCQPFGSDQKLVSPTGNSRYPDVQVDCARLSSSDPVSAEPRVVIEVLSPSNDWFDINKRLIDYQAHPAVRTVLFVSGLKQEAQAWTRQGDSWATMTLETADGVFDLPSIDAALSMEEIYMGVSFEEAPET